MNIQVQVCGLLVLLLLYVFYKSSKSLRLYSEKVFNIYLTVAIISLTMDILSIVAIEYRDKMSIWMVHGVCKGYIVSLIWLTMFALSYVLADLYSEQMHKKRSKYIMLICALQSCIVFMLPISIYDDDEAVYTYGAAVLCVYAFVVIYLIATIVVSIRFFKRLNKRRVLAVSLWMLIWIVAALIQFMNNELLIVGFASAIGSLIMFVIMENPEGNLDRRIGCFNSYALSEYLKNTIESNKQFSVLEISLDNFELLEESETNIDQIMRNILNFINREADTMAFKNFNSNLVIISSNGQKLKEAAEKILTKFSDDEVLSKEIKAVFVQDGNSFVSMDELFRFLTFIRMTYTEDNSKVLAVDEMIIEKFKEQYIIEQKIADALAEDRVEVFLQPIYSNKDGKFTSAEALVRIREKDGRLLSPGLFIPIAEVNGQIIELGDRVLEKVCECFKNTDILDLGIHYIEVNLSVVQCEMENLADRVIEIVKRYEIEPSRINLEITETASISARTVLLENMKKLIDYGFTFSLDDFGKGESNLMYIVEMPVSLVKLDYDMSKAFFNSIKAKHVVRAVVGMAHDLDLQLVAEGIETIEEIEGINQEGVDYIQGYYYSRPLPMPEFLDFLRKNVCC